ncbi:hypothetical protein [Streptomyces sp. NPDC096012]|uniref:hypothetical protein n=1 Tax=Streptomyces sp. NPDC096012 TaxID=3155684 RepID=UPI00336AD9C2
MDRESAYERLTALTARPAEPTARQEPATRAPAEEPSLVEQVVSSGMFRSPARSVGTRLGREITRSLFGTARRRR